MRVVVLGAGIAGLSCALELQRRGADAVIVERATSVGGLARTLEHEGHRFDLGGHRFHSNNPAVVAWIRDLLGDELLTVKRRSHIRIGGGLVSYPLELPDALAAFPLKDSLRMALSYLGAQLLHARRKDVSFEDWVVKRFGHALYDVFFRPYTEKVWGLPCDAISADWASARIGLPDLARAVRQLALPNERRPATSVSEFLYPRHGFGMISLAMERELRRLGADLRLGATPSAVRSGSREIAVDVSSADGSVDTIAADWVVSTIPPPALRSVLPHGPEPVEGGLDYRDLLCVFLEIDQPRVSEDHWTYFPDAALTFGRSHEPKNWSEAMGASPDRTSLLLEVFASRGDALWSLADAEIARRCALEMEAISFLPRGRVLSSRVVRVPNAYPVYRIGYRRHVTAFTDLVARHPRLKVCGRTGSFHYMNSDGVLENAFAVADSILPRAAPVVVPAFVPPEARWA